MWGWFCAWFLNYESVTLWIALASLAVSIAACLIAGSSLSQAKQVAERDRKDWKQRKWFDLFLGASEVYDYLDRFQAQYDAMSPTLYNIPEFERDFTDLMFRIRRVHAMAAVFPKNPIVTELFDATAAFKDKKEAVSKGRLTKVSNAVEGLREQAKLWDASVLE